MEKPNGQQPEENGINETNQFIESEAPDKTFDDFLDDIGGFGRWQKVIYVIIYIAEFFGAFGMMIPVFIGAVPIWKCSSWSNTTGDFDNYFDNNSTNSSDTNSSDYYQCEKDGLKCLDFEFEDDFTTIVSEWKLVCDMAYVSDLINSIQMVGLLIGAGTCGQLSDSFGRKKIYYMTISVLAVGGILSGISKNWQLYAACRAVVGFGFGGNMVVMCVYPIEFLGKKYRVLCGTLSFWGVGTIILGGLGYAMRDWRLLTIVSASTGIAYLFTWLLMDESPRWLMQQGRLEESEAVLRKIAQRNGTTPPEGSKIKAVAHLHHHQEADTKKYTYLDLGQSRLYRKRALILFITWFTTFFLVYVIHYNLKNFLGNRYFNMILAGICDWIAVTTVIPVYHYLGRRIGLTLYLSVAGASLIAVLAIILTGTDTTYPAMLLGFALVGKSAAACGTYAVMIYSAEIYPTVIRNVGVGTGCIAGRIGGIVAPQVVFLGTFYLAAPYIIGIVLVAIALPTLYLLPETSGVPLQDSLETRAEPPVEKEEIPL